MKRLLAVLALAFLAVGCNNATQGKVSVETYYGAVHAVHQPGEWYTTMSPGYEAHDVDTTPFTDDITVHVGTKDNAGLKLNIKVVSQVGTDTENIKKYVGRFGMDQEIRHKKRVELISGHVQTITRDAVGTHDAYSLYKEQAKIQQYIEEQLRPFLATQVFATLVSAQITDRPDFDNDEIEQAASRVVAAQKQKEAEQQYKEAAQTRLEKNQIENQIYSQSPQAYQLALLEKQREIAQAWSQHQGPLVFGGGTVQMQLTGKQ